LEIQYTQIRDLAIIRSILRLIEDNKQRKRRQELMDQLERTPMWEHMRQQAHGDPEVLGVIANQVYPPLTREQRQQL
jgi:methylphosphotriester-DNA--protein-cysteine methyltransferase